MMLSAFRQFVFLLTSKESSVLVCQADVILILLVPFKEISG